VTGVEFRTNAALTAFILSEAEALLASGSLIARDVLPVTAVPRRAGQIWYQTLDVLRIEDDSRTPGTIGPIGHGEGAWMDYPTLKQHSFAAEVYDEEVEEAGDQGIPINLQQDRASFALRKVLFAREKRLVDLIALDASFYAGTGGIVTTPAAKRWDNPNLPESNPLKDIDDMLSVLPFDPSHIIIPSWVQKKIAGHWCFVDLQKQFRSDLLTDGGLPPVIRKMKVLSPGQTIISNSKGIADAFAQLYLDDIVMFYQGGTTPGTNSVWGWGRTLTYKTPDPLVTETWRQDPEGRNFYRTRDKGSREFIISRHCAGVIRDTCSAT